MSFGLCNAPTMFIWCMTCSFVDMIEEGLDIFLYDFLVYENSFTECLENLKRVLERCEDTNLVLNWKKCHLMVTGGVVLRYRISKKGLEVDRMKIEVIEKILSLSSLRGIQIFLGHTGFYRRFINNFSHIFKPFCHLLQKDVPFMFGE